MLEDETAISVDAIPMDVYSHIGNVRVSGRQVVAELIDEFPELFQTVDCAIKFLRGIKWFETWEDYQEWAGDEADEADVFCDGVKTIYDVVDIENGMGYYAVVWGDSDDSDDEDDD